MKTYLLLISFLFMSSVHAQTVIHISVNTGSKQYTNAPLSYEVSDPGLTLVEVKGNKRIPVPFQLSPQHMHWILDGINPPNTVRQYELIRNPNTGITIKPNINPDTNTNPSSNTTPNTLPTTATMQAKDSTGSLILLQNGQHLLQYNYATVYPPKGVDSMYKRSGFIHPLWAPDGQVITNMHPADHWHHVGIWNPWTHTSFEGRETDFWNLQKKEGTVRFVSFISQTQGAVWCGFKALQDHIAINKEGQEKVALHEVWDIKAYNSGTDNSRHIWDFTSVLSCAGSSPLELLQYRYGGGFGFRATAAWNATNSKVLTSEGKTRANADSTRARWIKITGTDVGMLVICKTGNFDYPQPLRVWPENSEKGEIMMNYSPTKMKPWTLIPGNEYQQSYRVIVFKKDMTVKEIEDACNAFEHPPKITRL